MNPPPGRDLVGQQPDPLATAKGDQREPEPLHSGKRNEEVDRQRDHAYVATRARGRPSGAQDPAGDR